MLQRNIAVAAARLVHVENASPAHLHDCMVVKVVEWGLSTTAASSAAAGAVNDVALQKAVSHHLLHKVPLRMVHVREGVQRGGPIPEEGYAHLGDDHLNRARDHHDHCIGYGVCGMPSSIVAQVREDLAEVAAAQKFRNDPALHAADIFLFSRGDDGGVGRAKDILLLIMFVFLPCLGCHHCHHSIP